MFFLPVWSNFSKTSFSPDHSFFWKELKIRPFLLQSYWPLKKTTAPASLRIDSRRFFAPPRGQLERDSEANGGDLAKIPPGHSSARAIRKTRTPAQIYAETSPKRARENKNWKRFRYFVNFQGSYAAVQRRIINGFRGFLSAASCRMKFSNPGRERFLKRLLIRNRPDAFSGVVSCSWSAEIEVLNEQWVTYSDSEP